jgi:hypothetical protein
VIELYCEVTIGYNDITLGALRAGRDAAQHLRRARRRAPPPRGAAALVLADGSFRPERAEAPAAAAVRAHEAAAEALG